MTAYDASSGAEVAEARLSAVPTSIAVAADGDVWATFAPTNLTGQPRVSEFSADLSRRATIRTDDRDLAQSFDVLPLGSDQALVATTVGLVTVHLAVPAAGDVTVVANRNNAALDRAFDTSFGMPTELEPLAGGNVAVVLTADGGLRRVVRWHGDGSFTSAHVSMAASPEGLWVAAAGRDRPELQLLSDSLTPLPVGGVVDRATPPAGLDAVWTSGTTVWAATAGKRIGLVCFIAGGQSAGSHVGTVRLPAADSSELGFPGTAGGLIVAPTANAVYVDGPLGITGYPVPSACAG